MTLNYAFGFSLFLLILVGLNVYFFYTLNGVGKQPSLNNVPNINLDTSNYVFKDIYEYLYYLPSQYKTKNSKYASVQKNLIKTFNFKKDNNFSRIWHDTVSWTAQESLIPNHEGAIGEILHAMQNTQIALADNAMKGTQLKLLLLLQGNQKIYFKPKRYEPNEIIEGNVYGGFDRHNSEVFAYYLAMVMNFTWIAPAVIRKINIQKEIVPVATDGLKMTMKYVGNGAPCIYGKCFYCKENETVCGDKNGDLEGAAILFLDRKFRIFKSPWRRSYSSRKMEWEENKSYCKKIIPTLSMNRLLDIVDVSIFDFLIQNGDRHSYELYGKNIMLLDNGKGLGNHLVDELDILAPLYQCCRLRISTWHHLELLSGGSLTETMRMLALVSGAQIAVDEHFNAVERRLLKVYATIQLCIGRYGSGKVFLN